MYELVSLTFPFASDPSIGKSRPGFVISPAFGKYQQVIVAYVTTSLDEQLETDILLDPEKSYFSATGLMQKSLIKLHKLGTFQPIAIKDAQGTLPKEIIIELKFKLQKIFSLT